MKNFKRKMVLIFIFINIISCGSMGADIYFNKEYILTEASVLTIYTATIFNKLATLDSVNSFCKISLREVLQNKTTSLDCIKHPNKYIDKINNSTGNEKIVVLVPKGTKYKFIDYSCMDHCPTEVLLSVGKFKNISAEYSGLTIDDNGNLARYDYSNNSEIIIDTPHHK